MMNKFTSKEQIEKLLVEQRGTFLRTYKELVEIPSVSAQPEHRQDIQRVAKVAAEHLRKIGAEVRVFETDGNPVVFGRIENDPKAPTIAIYNHLDVQPAEKGKDGWTRDPFIFEEENGVFYGRGTTDCKGPAITAAWGASIARQLKIPMNVEFIWETEEEIGGSHFEQFLDQAKSSIMAEAILISDTIWLARGKPAISLGLRGLAGFLLRLRTGKKQVHSGLTGGAAKNPIGELCAIIAKCYDARTGDVTIPGFEKTWRRLPKDEIAGFVSAGFSASAFKTAYQLERMYSEDSAELAERVWGRPTFEVHGIVGGYQGEGIKTIIPNEAEAKISIRLVPGQDPSAIRELFARHVRTLNPDCAIVGESDLKPYTASKELSQVKAVREALKFGFGAEAQFIREGGSIGAAVAFQEKLGLPIVFMGLSLPEDSYHGPNESFRWEQIEGGVKSYVRLFELLGQP